MGIARKTLNALEEQSESDLERYKIFRANLRLLRYTRDLSAAELGKSLGFTKHYRIDSLETGKSATPKLEEVQAIAKYFGVTIDQLLYKQATITFL